MSPGFEARRFHPPPNHNIESWSARFLGEKSPIIDIEHKYLYSPTTMRRIFEINGYEVKEEGNVWNTYSITYLFHLLSLPSSEARSLNRNEANLGRGGLRRAAGSARIADSSAEVEALM
jgi:hypothetical protein